MHTCGSGDSSVSVHSLRCAYAFCKKRSQCRATPWRPHVELRVEPRSAEKTGSSPAVWRSCSNVRCRSFAALRPRLEACRGVFCKHSGGRAANNCVFNRHRSVTPWRRSRTPARPSSLRARRLLFKSLDVYCATRFDQGVGRSIAERNVRVGCSAADALLRSGRAITPATGRIWSSWCLRRRRNVSVAGHAGFTRGVGIVRFRLLELGADWPCRQHHGVHEGHGLQRRPDLLRGSMRDPGRRWRLWRGEWFRRFPIGEHHNGGRPHWRQHGEQQWRSPRCSGRRIGDRRRHVQLGHRRQDQLCRRR
jgi:hypothetical protein